jgi:hypothetical protein
MKSIGARWGLLGSPAALDAAVRPADSGTVPLARSGAAPTHVGEKDGASWLTDVAPSASGGSISEETNVPAWIVSAWNACSTSYQVVEERSMRFRHRQWAISVRL